LNNDNLRQDLQLGVQISPSKDLIYDKEFLNNFDTILHKRISNHELQTVSSKGFTI